ncbi:MAG TPA: sensor histidine kinase [Puia sp.]|nr:sensor histidine kinase [Puia sp.]
MNPSKKAYWICQLSGWTLYSCFHFYINSVGYIDSFYKAFLYCFLLIVAGVTLTFLYRIVGLRLGWLNLPLKNLLPRVLLAVMIMAFIMSWVHLRIELLTFPQFVQDITAILLIRTIGAWLEVFIIYTFIYHLYIYYRRSIKAEKARADAELNILRSQIHPHFYFNTLNNLYGLALQRSPRTEEAILLLSNIMEYVIYDCRSDKVALQKEIHFIESYIELEKLRIEAEERITISTGISGQDEDLPIAPLLLIPFVENAFKHGGPERPGEGERIRIRAVVKDRHFVFEVINQVGKTPGDHIGKASAAAGVGLENVRKRLDHLYPGKYRLQAGPQAGEYVVKLSIVL